MTTFVTPFVLSATSFTTSTCNVSSKRNPKAVIPVCSRPLNSSSSVHITATATDQEPGDENSAQSRGRGDQGHAEDVNRVDSTSFKGDSIVREDEFVLNHPTIHSEDNSAENSVGPYGTRPLISDDARLNDSVQEPSSILQCANDRLQQAECTHPFVISPSIEPHGERHAHETVGSSAPSAYNVDNFVSALPSEIGDVPSSNQGSDEDETNLLPFPDSPLASSSPSIKSDLDDGYDLDSDFEDDDDEDVRDEPEDHTWYSVSTAELDEAAARRLKLSHHQHHNSERNASTNLADSAATDVLDLGSLDEQSRSLLSEVGYARVLKLDVDDGGALENDDDNNDLFAGVGFDVILERQELVDVLREDFGFRTCTHIQLVAIPRIADGEDIVMQSYTGTGKTLAFLLPILETIDESIQAVQAIIVAPTRELAVQIANECARLCANMEIRTMALIGGANPQRQVDKIRRHVPHVVIGTPGRLAEFNQNRVISYRKVRILVIDEVDQCLDEAFLSHLETVISECPKDRQLVLCSATGDKDSVREFAQKWMQKPALLRIAGKRSMPANISHWSIVVPPRLRMDTVRKLMYTKDPPTQAICFVDDPRRVEIVCSHLLAMKVPVGALRGNAHKLERADVIRLFRKGVIKLLVTTEVAARGLDIPQVSHVINLDLPTDADHYIHRAGRCGRARAPGAVVSILSPETAFVIRRLEKELELPITPMELHGGDYVSPKPRFNGSDRREINRREPEGSDSPKKSGIRVRDQKSKRSSIREELSSSKAKTSDDGLSEGRAGNARHQRPTTSPKKKLTRTTASDVKPRTRSDISPGPTPPSSRIKVSRKMTIAERARKEGWVGNRVGPTTSLDSAAER